MERDDGSREKEMKRSIIQEVEEEFGEPFWDVVRGFAEDGYGCNTTAMILGYGDPVCFRRLIKRHGVKVEWPPHGQCIAQKNRQPLSDETKAKIASIKLASRDTIAARYEQRTGEPAVDAIMRMAKTMTRTDVAKAIGWKSPQPMTAWMASRGISVEFVKFKPIPRSKGRETLKMLLNW